MSADNSSTSNSERRDSLRILLFTLLWFFAIEVASSALLSVVENKNVGSSNFAVRYLSLGQTVETKLRTMVGSKAGDSDEMALVGWLPESSSDQPGDIVIYGNSFTKRLGQAVSKLAPDLRVRVEAAPLSTSSWSYAAFEADRQAREKVAVLTIGLVDAMIGESAISTRFTRPYPYGVPEYGVGATGLPVAKAEPLPRSLDDLREILESPQGWVAFRTEQKRRDPTFSSFVFDQSPLERSAFLRIVRRAWADHLDGQRVARVLQGGALLPDTVQVRQVESYVRGFAALAKERGQIGVVYLLNSRAFDLAPLVEPIAEAAGVKVLSTRAICPPDDLRSFSGPKGHFPLARDKRLAAELLELAGLSHGRR